MYAYTGKFREGRYDGKGHELYGDGSHYRGMFRKGLRHGYGKMVFTDGSSCEGTWRLGKKHGQCVLVYEKEKTVVEVGFVKGKRQGSCMTRHGDHDVVYSEWRDGLKIRDCITVQQHQAKEREARRKKRLERKRGQHLAVSGVDRYTSAKHTMSETSSVESAKLEQMKSKKDRKNEERRREKMNLSRLQYRSSVASALSSSSLSSNGTDVNHHNNSAGAGAGASAGSDCANGTGNGQGSGNGMVRKRRGGAKVRAGVNHDRNKYTKHTRNKHSKLDAQMSNGESSGVDSDDDDEEDEEESLTMLDY